MDPNRYRPYLPVKCRCWIGTYGSESKVTPKWGPHPKVQFLPQLSQICSTLLTVGQVPVSPTIIIPFFEKMSRIGQAVLVLNLTAASAALPPIRGQRHHQRGEDQEEKELRGEAKGSFLCSTVGTGTYLAVVRIRIWNRFRPDPYHHFIE